LTSVRGRSGRDEWKRVGRGRGWDRIVYIKKILAMALTSKLCDGRDKK
jgi:hypothetical protein